MNKEQKKILDIFQVALSKVTFNFTEHHNAVESNSFFVSPDDEQEVETTKYSDEEIREFIFNHYKSILIFGPKYLDSFVCRGARDLMNFILKHSIEIKNYAYYDFIFYETIELTKNENTLPFYTLYSSTINGVARVLSEDGDISRLKHFPYSNSFNFIKDLGHNGSDKEIEILKYCLERGDDDDMISTDEMRRFHYRKSGINSIIFLANNLHKVNHPFHGSDCWSRLEKEFKGEKDGFRSYYFQDVLDYKQALLLRHIGSHDDVTGEEIIDYLTRMNVAFSDDALKNIVEISEMKNATLPQMTVSRISESMNAKSLSDKLKANLPDRPSSKTTNKTNKI